jgi:hypothetical protein
MPDKKEKRADAANNEEEMIDRFINKEQNFSITWYDSMK